MVAVSTPGSSGWRCLVCLSVWGWLRRRHCFRSQESHRHWECPESWSVLHPANAHAPNNVTCSGDSGEGRPLCGQEDSDWAFGAKWSFYSPPNIKLIFGSILSWIVLNHLFSYCPILHWDSQQAVCIKSSSIRNMVMVWVSLTYNTSLEVRTADEIPRAHHCISLHEKFSYIILWLCCHYDAILTQKTLWMM